MAYFFKGDDDYNLSALKRYKICKEIFGDEFDPDLNIKDEYLQVILMSMKKILKHDAFLVSRSGQQFGSSPLSMRNFLSFQIQQWKSKNQVGRTKKGFLLFSRTMQLEWIQRKIWPKINKILLHHRWQWMFLEYTCKWLFWNQLEYIFSLIIL